MPPAGVSASPCIANDRGFSMNNELMLDENFIRCSTMIAELLMKYKSKENKELTENEEHETDSSSSFLPVIH